MHIRPGATGSQPGIRRISQTGRLEVFHSMSFIHQWDRSFRENSEKAAMFRLISRCRILWERAAPDFMARSMGRLQSTMSVRNLSVPETVGQSRFQLRQKLLAGTEQLSSVNQMVARPKSLTTYYDQAMGLMTSSKARDAFNIQLESPELREKYGYSSIGQCALLSRRLVEAGGRFIAIDHGSWDTHFDNFTSHEKSLCPPTDRALSALLTDLDDRGMLDETLVVMMGEMGRTPRINNDAGRDHWSACQTVILAGGGIKRGVVVGASDKTASYPTTQPYGIHDLLRTIFFLMGIDSDKVHLTPLGRPVPIVNGGKKIDEVLV